MFIESLFWDSVVQEAFAEYFPDQGEIEDSMWKGLLFTAVGLGALASVVATR